MDRDERAIIQTTLDHAGLSARIDESGGFPVASFSVASHELPEPTRFMVDAPQGWLRVATTLDRPNVEIAARHALGLVYTQTGFGHVHYDVRNGAFRIAASLQAVDRAPMGSALIAAIEHLGKVRHKIATGQGDIRAVDVPTPSLGDSQTPLPDEPTLADAVRVLEKTVSLIPGNDGSFVGGLHEPRSDTRCALRIHTALPGIFAVDAWRLPPARIPVEPPAIEQVDSFNASLTAGALMLFHDGLLLYRWACPYAWLDLAQLEAAVPLQAALDAFMRFQLA